MQAAIADLAPIPLGAAIVAAWLIGYVGVDLVFRWSTDKLKVEDNPLFKVPGAGQWIGALERIVFLIAIIAGRPEAIAAWLVFKVAAKWETWAHIVKFPELDENSEDDLGRIRFANWLHSKFLIGTLLNILIAIFAAWLYSAIDNFLIAGQSSSLAMSQ